jgi:aryl-alcohol dehydrogenase-like predicted oxidoreductase
MRYRLLGKSGLRVSELCLGTMTFGEDWGWGASKEDSKRVFDAFAGAGGNFIDTACNYTNGTAEKYVGELISGDRDSFVVATKYSLRRPGSDKKDLNAGGNARKNMMRSVEASLKRLNTDYIDVLYVHIWDYTTPIEEILRGLDDMVRAGKILYTGISDTAAWVASQAQAIADLRGWSRFVAYEGAYNLLERGIERDVLPMTRALDMSVLAFSLLAGGALTGKFNQPGGPGEPTRVRKASELQKRAADTVAQVAAEIDRTPSQVAINWVRQQSPNIIPILGARRESQIQDNLGILDFTLSAEHMKRLSAIDAPEEEFPADFWNDFVRRDLIFGERVDAFDVRQP